MAWQELLYTWPIYLALTTVDKRSAILAQFIIHRGLIISFIQAVFSALFYFAAIAIYTGWLLVGYDFSTCALCIFLQDTQRFTQ